MAISMRQLRNDIDLILKRLEGLEKRVKELEKEDSKSTMSSVGAENTPVAGSREPIAE